MKARHLLFDVILTCALLMGFVSSAWAHYIIIRGRLLYHSTECIADLGSVGTDKAQVECTLEVLTTGSGTPLSPTAFTTSSAIVAAGVVTASVNVATGHPQVKSANMTLKSYKCLDGACGSRTHTSTRVYNCGLPTPPGYVAGTEYLCSQTSYTHVN